ncbi:UNKNOWN [Stylonychia lemnae]|uniref:FHA domain-containing protein n=1 Tax=Stylonychia lemnae TaxID=5949 RepID=A0A077ZV61_STYLE|nr:UNKNOWN [Stylonychia lemnae]|eukprot:CDW73785.1 UNKNOWN [Stylonychia lemnae]
MGNQQQTSGCCGFFGKIDNHELCSPEKRIIQNQKSPKRNKHRNGDDIQDQENIDPNQKYLNQHAGAALQSNKYALNVNNNITGDNQFEGEMHITTRKDNDLLVKHIRTTSMLSKSEYNFTRVRELAKIVDQAPKLNIKVLSSGPLKGHILKINAQGLESSERSQKDGFVYFGSKKRSGKRDQYKSEIINDFIIPSKDKETERRHRGRHLQIEYNMDKNIYQIKDLGIGFGAFVRVDFPLELKENQLLNMGDSFIIVNLVNDRLNIGNNSLSTHESKLNNESGMKLRLKLFGGPSTGEVFYFYPERDVEDQVIKIGRSKECDVMIEDQVLSKFQSHISFDKTKQCWYLRDGYNNKNSLNGTWLYLNDDFEVYDGMTFKANQTLFQAFFLN